mmetsp:Transcript_93771/g.284773  ORF Transcript_93771/g.284773 Transcript_93771/m.284773 type:complete len:227 (+) Transcript_93771:3-683(+)
MSRLKPFGLEFLVGRSVPCLETMAASRQLAACVALCLAAAAPALGFVHEDREQQQVGLALVDDEPAVRIMDGASMKRWAEQHPRAQPHPTAPRKQQGAGSQQPPRPQQVQLVVVHPQGGELTLQMKRSAKLEGLMVAVAKYLDMPQEKVSFYRHDQLLKPSDTADSLGLKDMETINLSTTAAKATRPSSLKGKTAPTAASKLAAKPALASKRKGAPGANLLAKHKP